MLQHPRVSLLVVVLGGFVSLGAARVHDWWSGPNDRVQPNDNRQPAGIARGDTVTLRLEARTAMWLPHTDSGPGVPMPAFAETGGAARIPGPLIRVRSGTEARVTVTNSLRDTLRVQGLYARRASPSTDTLPLVLAPGETRRVTFRLEANGTYYYWGTTTRRRIDFRTLEDAQLTGAIVVDARDASLPPRDRIFVIGMWTDTVHRSGAIRKRVLAVINGRSWPNTERLTHDVGDTVPWRVINASGDLHPMHLHGFYCRVDARGDGYHDATLTPDARRLAVTESINAGATARLTWIPERAGNWLFHCHIPEHFERRGPFGLAAAGASHGDHARDGMNGLVMGITVREGRARAVAHEPSLSERRLRVIVRPRNGSTDAEPRYEYAIHESGPEPPVGAIDDPPATLDVARGQPVRITVVNRLTEATAVHWHGIELESYFDGVPGFSDAGQRVTPLIAPRDSFEVRFTPPRAGTFIFHTHADEIRQQFAGLAGALVVSEPGDPRDASHDIPLVMGELRSATDGRVTTVINGRADGPPLELRAGESYRFRFVQMSVARAALRVELLRDSSVLT